MIKIFKKIAFKKKRKGSTALEATMIFPFIMFIFFGIIYFTLVHYQNVAMISESMRAMNRAGAYWQYIDMDAEGKHVKYEGDKIPIPFDNSIEGKRLINPAMLKYRNVYRTIIDVVAEGFSKFFNTPVGDRKYNAKQYVSSRIAGVKFKMYRSENEADVIGNVGGEGFMFVGPDLSIVVHRTYINPLHGLSTFFLGENNPFGNKDGKLGKEITVKSIISNQSEFIRNLDAVYDIGSKTYNLIEYNKNKEDD